MNLQKTANSQKKCKFTTTLLIHRKTVNLQKKNLNLQNSLNLEKNFESTHCKKYFDIRVQLFNYKDSKFKKGQFCKFWYKNILFHRKLYKKVRNRTFQKF